jgi:alpha-tubulin suppressor-like RCC1 family protein
VNNYGQLGNGAVSPDRCQQVLPCSTTPVKVTGLSGVRALSASQGHTCALLSDGTVFCWGHNDAGQLGIPPKVCSQIYPCSSTPVVVAGLSGVTAVATGGQHTCALLSDTTVRCWGDNTYGQLGDNAAQKNSLKPVTVVTASGAPLAGVTAISAGDAFSCALLSGGSVVCWGGGPGFAELGALMDTDAAQSEAQTPQPVTWVTGAVAIASSVHSSTCVITTAGTVECWGTAAGGGANMPAVGDLTGVKAVAPAYQSPCALLTAGTVSCWGVWPQGTEDHPTPVSGLTDVTAVVTTDENACALSSDGRVSCWGSGQNGTLGDGTTANATTPVGVPL